MTDTYRQTIGKNAEHEACAFLEAKGFRLIKPNFRCKMGEIDLVMQDGADLVFVEVRKRSRQDYGSALQSIDKNKQRKLIKAATYYLLEKKLYNKIGCRFDVITINAPSSIEWIKNAFSVDSFL